MIENFDADIGGGLIPTPHGDKEISIIFSLLCYDGCPDGLDGSEIEYLVS